MDAFKITTGIRTECKRKQSRLQIVSPMWKKIQILKKTVSSDSVKYNGFIEINAYGSSKEKRLYLAAEKDMNNCQWK